MIRRVGMEFDKPQMAFRVVLTVVGLWWMVLMFVRLRSPDSAQERTQDLVALMVGTFTWVGAWQGVLLARTWGAAARVLRARQAPTALWRQCLHSSLQSAGQVWAVLALGLVCVMLPAHSPFQGLTALALFAVVVCLALVVGLATVGLMPRVWLCVYPVAVSLIVLVPALGFGLTQIGQFLDAIPGLLRVAACLAVPALLAWLRHTWLGGPPPAADVPPTLNVVLLGKRVKAWLAQYRLLTPDHWRASGVAPSAQNTSLQALMGPLMAMIFGELGMKQALGGSLIFSHVLWLGLMLVWVSSSLVCKNLHWRLLLVPRGPHRGRLGVHIALSTATMYVLWFVAIFCVGLVVSALSDRPFDFLQRVVNPMGTLPFELIFVISLGTLVRGTRHPWRWFLLLAVMWLLLLWACFDAQNVMWLGSFGASAISVDFPYLLILLVLSALALWASNKLWTVERMLQTTRQDG